MWERQGQGGIENYGPGCNTRFFMTLAMSFERCTYETGIYEAHMDGRKHLFIPSFWVSPAG